MKQNKLFIEELKKDIARLEEVIKEKQSLLNQLEAEEVEEVEVAEVEEVAEEIDPLQADVTATQLKGKIKYTITFPNGEVINTTATKARDFALIIFDEAEAKKYSIASKGKIETIESTIKLLDWQIEEEHGDFKYFTIKLPSVN